jgi:DNA-directed RNA polymerase specialized sigma24 family protein
MAIAAMDIEEVLAIGRLRQWAVDRLALADARTTNYRRVGWSRRNERGFDARNVRVIDFGRALRCLDADEQLALVLRYRDKETDPNIAVALHCSVRRISYLVPVARRKLAAQLLALNLL